MSEFNTIITLFFAFVSGEFISDLFSHIYIHRKYEDDRMKVVIGSDLISITILIVLLIIFSL